MSEKINRVKPFPTDQLSEKEVSRMYEHSIFHPAGMSFVHSFSKPLDKEGFADFATKVYHNNCNNNFNVSVKEHNLCRKITTLARDLVGDSSALKTIDKIAELTTEMLEEERKRYLKTLIKQYYALHIKNFSDFPVPEVPDGFVENMLRDD